MYSQSKEILKIEKKDTITPEKLRYMAFNGDIGIVYTFFKKLNPESRYTFSDKYIFSEVIEQSIKKINDFENVYNEKASQQEKYFLIETTQLFLEYCENNSTFPREFYSTLLRVADELTRLAEFDKAFFYLDYLLKHSVDKYPELRIMTLFRIAFIHNANGELQKAQELFSKMVEHPYLISDKSKIADLLFKLSQSMLRSGNILQYKKTLFLGLRFFYTNADDRKRFFDQLKLTYKSSFLILLSSEIAIYNKFLFIIHWLFYKRPNFYKIKLGFISRFVEKAFLGVIYLLNYASGGESIKSFREINNKINLSITVNNSTVSDKNKSKKKILITRAMGGIGDLLMMTPGINALKKKYPKHEIHLAVPKRYFPVFEGNDDVNLINIEDDFFSHITYKKWYNFTDCPAARVESRTSPKVKKSRIRIFTNALGINHINYILADKKPRFFLSRNEEEFASEFFTKNDLTFQTVIGVQLHSDESYRDFPMMEQLVARISAKYKILVFDSEPIVGYNIENVIKIQSLSIRNAFALVSKCNAIIAPDSSFIHLAAAFNIPTIALFGPIDGKVRTKHYPYCTYINSKDLFGCLPCWRNESIPCKLTGMRQSICLSNIPINKIQNELEKILFTKEEK